MDDKIQRFVESFDSEMLAARFLPHSEKLNSTSDLPSISSLEFSDNRSLFELSSDSNAFITTNTVPLCFQESVSDMTRALANAATLILDSNPGYAPESSPESVSMCINSNASVSGSELEGMQRFPVADNSFSSHDAACNSFASFENNNFAAQDSAADLGQFDNMGDMHARKFASTSQGDFGLNFQYPQSNEPSHAAPASYMLFNNGSYLSLANAQLSSGVMAAIPTMSMEQAIIHQQGYDSGFSSPPTLQSHNLSYFASPSEKPYQVASTSNEVPAIRRKRSSRPRLFRLSDCQNEELHCPYPGCGKKFNRFHNLKSHLIVHTEARPFKCSQCELTFRRNHDLRRHERMHKGLRPYSCNKCGKSFCRSDALKRHVKVDACGEYSFSSLENLVSDNQSELPVSVHENELYLQTATGF